MKLLSYFVSSLTFLSGTLAVNNFAGITASNAIGGAGAYTCRTQAQVSRSFFTGRFEC